MGEPTYQNGQSRPVSADRKHRRPDRQPGETRQGSKAAG